MHHRISQRNKPKLLEVKFYINTSKGKVCIGKKTINARMLVRECVKHRDIICSTSFNPIMSREFSILITQ